MNLVDRSNLREVLMDGQMTIFEFLPQESDFAAMPEAQVIRIISDRIGIELKYTEYGDFHEYSAKVGKLTITAKISTYLCTHGESGTVIDGHKFISVGYGNSNGGAGSPCDSIDEAVEFLKKAIEKGRGKL